MDARNGERRESGERHFDGNRGTAPEDGGKQRQTAGLKGEAFIPYVHSGAFGWGWRNRVVITVRSAPLRLDHALNYTLAPVGTAVVLQEGSYRSDLRPIVARNRLYMLGLGLMALMEPSSM